MFRFGLLRFGLPGGGLRVRVRVNMSASVEGTVSAAKDIRTSAVMAETVLGKAHMDMDILFRGTFAEEVKGAACLGKNIGFAPEMREEVHAVARLVKNIGVHNRPGRIRGVNANRFGLLRFGLPGGEVTVRAAINMSERVMGMFGAGKNVRASGANPMTAAVKCSIMATAGIRTRFDGQAIMGGVMRLNKDIRFEANMQEAVMCNAYAAKNLQIYGTFTEDVKAVAYLGKNIGFAVRMSDALLADIHAVKDIRTSLELGEAVMGILSPALLDTEVFHLDVTVPPGGVITIDSDHYEAYLDNQRVLHLQSGDWIFPDRDLIDVIVDTGSGGALAGWALYKERYL